MRFSTRSTYGLRAIIRLAKHWGKGNISLSHIAKSENISKGYLEQLFSQLKKADIIESEKGMSGGYQLSKDPAEINVFDVIRALEGEGPLFYCLGADGKVYCNSKCRCGASTVLAKAQRAVNLTLKNIRLKDL